MKWGISEQVSINVDVRKIEKSDTDCFLTLGFRHQIVFSSWINENELPIEIIAKSLAIALKKPIEEVLCNLKHL